VKDNIYTFSYAGILGLACALLLTGVSQLTGEAQRLNREAEKNRNILGVLEVEVPEDANSRDLQALFNANVRQESRGNLALFQYIPAGGANVAAVAVEFEGPGLWGPVKGFLSLEPDMKTIKGMTVYEQEETPGLGGDIGTPGFQEKFKGRSIMDSSGKPGIVIKQSGASAQNEIEGITGATMTCEKLQAMLNEVIEEIAKE